VENIYAFLDGLVAVPILLHFSNNARFTGWRGSRSPWLRYPRHHAWHSTDRCSIVFRSNTSRGRAIIVRTSCVSGTGLRTCQGSWAFTEHACSSGITLTCGWRSLAYRRGPLCAEVQVQWGAPGGKFVPGFGWAKFCTSAIPEASGLLLNPFQQDDVPGVLVGIDGELLFAGVLAKDRHTFEVGEVELFLDLACILVHYENYTVEAVFALARVNDLKGSGLLAERLYLLGFRFECLRDQHLLEEVSRRVNLLDVKLLLAV
jgi:hypothetical protein